MVIIKRYISAHFRLKRNQEHDLHCFCIIENYVKNIQNSQSKTVESSEKNIKEIQEQDIVLRLNFLDELLKAEKDSRDNMNGRAGSTDESSTKEGISYTNRNREISPYFRTAMDVARIRALVNADGLQNLSIKHKNLKIYWTDFLFDKPRYWDLYKRITNGARISHPVALLVVPEKPEQDQLNIRCAKGGNGINCVDPYLSFFDSELTESIELKEPYIVLGCPTGWKPKKSHVNPRLYIIIRYRDQIANINRI